MQTTGYILSDREHATVLAALRFWQRNGARQMLTSDNRLAVDDIATRGGELTALSFEEIDSLCGRLNVEPAPAKPAVPESLALASLEYIIEYAETHVNDWEEDVRFVKPSERPEFEDACRHIEAAKALIAGKPKLPTLAVVLEGGLVSAVVSDNPRAVADSIFDIMIIDYDTDGAAGDDVSMIRQNDGTYSEAFVHSEGIMSTEIDLSQAQRETDARNEAVANGWRYDMASQTFDKDDGGETDEESEAWAELCEKQGIEF